MNRFDAEMARLTGVRTEVLQARLVAAKSHRAPLDSLDHSICKVLIKRIEEILEARGIL